MNDRDIGSEIVPGIREIKNYNNRELDLDVREYSEPIRPSHLDPPSAMIIDIKGSTMDKLSFARRYLDALENFLTGDELSQFFTADVIQIEFPNRLTVNGAQRDLTAVLQGAEQGKMVLSKQTYEITNAIESGDQLALEVVWTGTLAIDLAPLSAGDQMRAHFAVFLKFRDGKIAGQYNYDCFDPF